MAAMTVVLARYPADLLGAGLLAKANKATENLARTPVNTDGSHDCGP